MLVPFRRQGAGASAPPPAHAVGSPAPDSLASLVARFLLTCGTEATRRTYRSILRDFAPTFDAVGRAALEGDRLRLAAELYIADLRQRLEARRESAATVKRKISGLSSFLHFCVENSLLVRNPLERMKRPSVRPDTSAHRALSREERDRLLARATLERESPHEASPARRMWARKLELAIKLCLTCGCRVGELLKLRACDIEILDNEKARVVLLAKGAERHAPLIPRGLAERLLALAADAHGPEGLGFSVFAGQAKAQSVEDRINVSLSGLAQRAGIEKHVTVHTLRATCATLHHDAGVPIIRIQRLLGHKNLATTSMYIRSAHEELLEGEL